VPDREEEAAVEVVAQTASRKLKPRSAGVPDKSVSLLTAFFAIAQLLRSLSPVFVRRAFRATSHLPEVMSQCRNLVVTEHREPMFIQTVLPCFSGVLVSQSGMLQSLPGEFLASFVILLLMGFRGTQMSVRGIFV
jgi:hypothetical protein